MGLTEQDILPHLLKGEHLLWFGRPTRTIPHPRRNPKDIALWIFFVVGLIWARTYLIESALWRVLTLLFILLLCGIWCIILVVEPFAEKKRVRQTAYAITSKRAIGLSGKHVFSQPLNADTRYRLSGTNPETLEIWSNADQARAEVPPMRFQQLADGAAAYAVLEQLLKPSDNGL